MIWHDFQKNKQTAEMKIIARAVLYWWELIPFYQRISKIIFKICFWRSCSPCLATKQTYFGNFTHLQTHIVAHNHQASARLHNCPMLFALDVLCLPTVSVRRLLQLSVHWGLNPPQKHHPIFRQFTPNILLFHAPPPPPPTLKI